MSRRALVLALALSASVATSYPEEVDYRTPCTNGSEVVQDWDANRPLYLKWWGTKPIPTGANLRTSIIVQPVGGEPIDYWAEAAPGSVVHICPKGGLLPDTEYEWRVRQFVNESPNHLPVPYFEHTGIVRFRTAATSTLDPIESARACRRFDDWDFLELPACTSGWFDADQDGWGQQEDCDDGDPQVRPDATERCDGVDNDCDGRIDEGSELRVWTDADGDGFGDPSGAIDLECGESAPGTVASGTDCDDSNPDIHPAAEDLSVNGIDEDCDGMDGVQTSETGLTGDTGDVTGGTAETGIDTDTDTGTTGNTGHTG